MSDILGKLIVKIATDAAEFSGGLDSAQGKLAAVGQKMTSIGSGLTLGVTGPLMGIAAVAVDAASDLNESASKVAVVFGAQATAIEEWAGSAATALGQSKQQALEAVGTYGNLFTAMGMGRQQSADMSMSLVQLASDLASFNNLDPTEALEKLRAGLLGETEPLRSMGVNLSAAAVEARALEMGLAASSKELTPAMKAQASYALILEQTKNAQGDFARTSDGLANSQRIMKAQISDAAAAIGVQLLPIALKIVTAINSWIEKFTNLSPEMQKTIVVVGGVAAAIGPVLVVVGTLISSIGTIIGAFTALGPVAAGAGAVVAALGGPITLIVAAIGGLAYAWSQNWLGIRDFTDGIFGHIDLSFGGLKNAMASTWEGIKALNQLGWDDYKAMANGAMAGVESALGLHEGAIKETFFAAWDAIKSAVMAVDWLGLGTAIIQGIITGITTAGSMLADAVQDVAGGFWSGLQSFLGIGDSGGGGTGGSVPYPVPVGMGGGGGRAQSIYNISVNVYLTGSGSSVQDTNNAANAGVLEALRSVGLG